MSESFFAALLVHLVQRFKKKKKTKKPAGSCVVKGGQGLNVCDTYC